MMHLAFHDRIIADREQPEQDFSEPVVTSIEERFVKTANRATWFRRRFYTSCRNR